MSDDTPSNECPVCTSQCLREPEIDAMRAKIEQLELLVVTDPLTQTYNKRHFTESLTKELERTRRNQLPTSLILLDIDHFKQINDEHGHLTGDRVLEAVGHTLRNTMRITDIPCRYGGEEFALILPSTPLTTAKHVAQRLCESIASCVIELKNGTRLNVTASLGVSEFRGLTNQNGEDLFERADQQLYQAKNSGRNRVHCEPQHEQSTQLSQAEKEALFKADE